VPDRKVKQYSGIKLIQILSDYWAGKTKRLVNLKCRRTKKREPNAGYLSRVGMQGRIGEE
jgi:hypothetical protein